MPHLSPITWTFLYIIIWSTILFGMIATETSNPTNTSP